MAPAFSRTPESLLSGLRRSDSKNPLTTCHGTTAAGRPCRRSLAAAVNALNAAETHSAESSVIAVLEENEYGSEITAFFCWQHKDQADTYHADRTRKVQLRTRGSLEDMMSSMGLHDAKEIRTALKQRPRRQRVVSEPPPAESEPHLTERERPGRRATAPRTGTVREHAKRRRDPRNKSSMRPSFWQALCGCYTESSRDSKDREPPRMRERPRKASEKNVQTWTDPERPKKRERSESALEIPADAQSDRSDELQMMQVASQRPSLRESHSQPVVTRKPLSKRPTGQRSSLGGHTSPLPPSNVSAMNEALSMIPENASFTLASALIAEMGKVAQDDREGYIYMYWLDEAEHIHADDDGESLLSANNPRHSPNATKKLLLKIGRAENVHRRLSQWQLQCGYKPLLVRSYPRADSGIKVQHLHRVERLIHTELSDRNVKRRCGPCAKEHREWFEVDGREGVREVNRVIEKWVAWSARQPDS